MLRLYVHSVCSSVVDLVRGDSRVVKQCKRFALEHAGNAKMFRDHGQAMHARFVGGGWGRGRGVRGTQLFDFFVRPNADDGFDVCHVRDKDHST